MRADSATIAGIPRTSGRVDGCGNIRAGALLVGGVLIGASSLFGSFYDLTVWGPIGVIVLAGVMTLAVVGVRRLPANALVPAAALAGLAVFQWLSHGWAESANAAYVAAARTTVYAGLVGILVIALRSDRDRVTLAAGLGSGAALAAAFEVTRLLLGHAAGDFVGGRLNDPLGYYNGEAAAILVAFWPAIALAEVGRRALWRGLGLGAGTLVVSVSLLAQSRGAALALVASALLLLAFVPGRMVRLVALIVVAAVVAAVAPSIFHVYDSLPPGTGVPRQGAVSSALVAAIGASAVAGVFWGCASWLVSRKPGLQQQLTSRRVSRAVAAAIFATLLALSVVAGPRVAHQADRQWKDFTHLRTVRSATRFTSAGGNRYDYWRIAWAQFKSHPAGGVGAGNFGRTYFLERRTSEDVRQAHNFWLQALGETGLIGFLLILTAVAAIALGFARSARSARQDPLRAGLAVAGGGGFTLWLVQTSADWLHLLPGLTAAALAFAAIVVTSADVAPLPVVGRHLPLRPLTFAAATLAAGAIGVLTLAATWTHQAERRLVTDPSSSASKARDALRLNSRDLDSYFVLAAALARNNQYSDARTTLRRAAALEPHNFVPYVLLGDIAVRRHDLQAAVSAYDRALALNPRQPGLRTALRGAQRELRKTG